MNKCKTNQLWINTEVEFTWSDELQQMVEISSQGYCYDGEIAGCMDPGDGDGDGDGDGGGGGGGGGGGDWNTPFFSYLHQPVSVQQAQYENGYYVDNDLIIPSAIHYDEQYYGWISMVCRCDDINATSTSNCNIEQETCVIWQVFDIADTNINRWLPYQGDQGTNSYTNAPGGTPSYEAYDHEDIIDVMCSSADPYDIIMETDQGGGDDNSWPSAANNGAATPCLTMYSNTCIKKSDLLIALGYSNSGEIANISNWHNSSVTGDDLDFYNSIRDYWYGNMTACINDGDMGCGGFDNTCYEVFDGDNFPVGKYTMMYLDFRGDTWRKSTPFMMIGENPVITSITGLESSPGWVAKYDSSNIIGDNTPIETSTYDYNTCESMGLGDGGTTNGTCPPIGQYLSENEQGMMVLDDLTDTVSYTFLDPCFQLTSTSHLNRTHSSFKFGVNIYDAITDTHSFGASCHVDNNFDGENLTIGNTGFMGWPYLRSITAYGSMNHNSEDGIMVCCTEGNIPKTGTHEITISGVDHQGDDMDVYFSPYYEGPTGSNHSFNVIGTISGEGSITTEVDYLQPGNYTIAAYGIDESNNQGQTFFINFQIGGEDLGTPGCIDDTACNYNAEATVNDNSCIYQVQFYQDSDGDGLYDDSGDGTGIPCGDPICIAFESIPEQEGYSCVQLITLDPCTGAYDECGECNGPGLGSGNYHTCCDGTEVCSSLHCDNNLDEQDPQECCENPNEEIYCYCDEDGDGFYEGSGIIVGGYCNPICSDYAEYCYDANDDHWADGPIPETLGCTESWSCNYNPSATQNDGTCNDGYPAGLELYCETIYDSGDENGGVEITYTDIEVVGGHDGTDAGLNSASDIISYPFQADFYSISSEQDFFDILNASYIPDDGTGVFTNNDVIYLWYNGETFAVMRFQGSNWSELSGSVLDVVNKRGASLLMWLNKTGVINWTLSES